MSVADVQTISPLEAVQELRSAELGVWLLLHTLKRSELTATSSALLARGWKMSPKVTQRSIRGLLDKRFVTRERRPGWGPKKFSFALCRRLDVSTGQFAKFARK